MNNHINRMKPESRTSHALVAPTNAQTCDQIMAFPLQGGPYGFAPDELAAGWQRSHKHVVPRITEPKASGQLVLTDRCRTTRTGSPARVLVAKPFARPSAQTVASQTRSMQKSRTGAESLFHHQPERHREDG